MYFFHFLHDKFVDSKLHFDIFLMHPDVDDSTMNFIFLRIDDQWMVLSLTSVQGQSWTLSSLIIRNLRHTVRRIWSCKSLDLVKWIYAVSVIPAQRCHMYLFLATWYRPWITDRVRIKHIYFLTIFAIQHFLQNTKKRHLNSIYIVEIMFVMYMNSVFSWLLPSWI